MITLEDLKKDAKIKRLACTAYAISSSDKVFALNGERLDKTSKIYKDASRRIRGLLGKGSHIANTCHSFTIFPYVFAYNSLYPIYKFEDFVYKEINDKGFVSFQIDNRNIKKVKYYKWRVPKYDSRIFGCCERKIIGYIEDKGKNPNDYDFFVRINPCMLCFPLLKNVNYFDRYTDLAVTINISSCDFGTFSCFCGIREK